MRTNEVGPVKPSSKGAPKADVEAAPEVSGSRVQAHRRLLREQLRKTEAKVEPKVDDARLSSLEEKIEMLTQLMALQMQGEQSTSVKAESLEEILSNSNSLKMTMFLQILMLGVYVTLTALTAICAFRLVSDWLNCRNESGLCLYVSLSTHSLLIYEVCT